MLYQWYHWKLLVESYRGVFQSNRHASNPLPFRTTEDVGSFLMKKCGRRQRQIVPDKGVKLSLTGTMLSQVKAVRSAVNRHTKHGPD